ncbi:MAG: 2OG-Fe(II) oxygenase family protein [Pseudomonadota bacterium]
MTDFADAREIAVDDIPVIDIGPLHADGGDAAYQDIGARLLRAATTAGFFYVGNHGLGQDVVDAAFACSRRFFAQPDAVKGEVRVSERHRGWLPVGEAKMAGHDQPDLKESYIWGLDLSVDDPAVTGEGAMIGVNRWPVTMPDMRQALMAYFDGAHDVARLMFGAFAAALGVPRDTFTGGFERPISRASLIHYPTQAARDDAQFGVAPHTDYGCMTILAQDDVGGLEVLARDGDWLTAHPIPGTLVVNVGDLLERWTNDLFASTRHRVVNRAGRERFSIAVAVDPDSQTVIDPVRGPGEDAHYPPVTCGDYIRGRFDESFAYRKAASRDGASAD